MNFTTQQPISDPAEQAPEGDTAAERPKTRQFRKRFSGPRIAPDAAERQGRVTMLAWRLLGGRDGAVAFLNAHHDGLGGRPLDLAVVSEEACAAVSKAITDHAGTGQPPA